MTDLPIEDAVIVDETPAAEQPPKDKYKTAFVVLKRPDGTYVAVSDLETTYDIERQSTLIDVKRGAQDVLDAVKEIELANLLRAVNGPQMPPQADHTH